MKLNMKLYNSLGRIIIVTITKAEWQVSKWPICQAIQIVAREREREKRD